MAIAALEPYAPLSNLVGFRNILGTERRNFDFILMLLDIRRLANVVQLQISRRGSIDHVIRTGVASFHSQRNRSPQSLSLLRIPLPSSRLGEIIEIYPFELGSLAEFAGAEQPDEVQYENAAFQNDSGRGRRSLAGLGTSRDDAHGYLHANVDHATEDIKMFLGNCQHLADCTQGG